MRPQGGLARVLLAASAAACALAVPSALAGPADDVISIGGGPSGETTSRDATFTFGPSGRTSYAYATCDLDGSGESRCASPASYSELGLGSHRFIVRAYSSRGGLLGSDARSWTVVAAQPPPPPPPPPPPSPPPPIQPGPPPVLPDFFLTAAPYGGPKSLSKPVKTIVLKPGQKGTVAIAIVRIGPSKGSFSYTFGALAPGVTTGISQDVIGNPTIVTVHLFASFTAKPVAKKVTLTAKPSSPLVGPVSRTIEIPYLVVEEYDLAVAGIDVTQGIQLPQSQTSALPARDPAKPTAPVSYPGAVNVKLTGNIFDLDMAPLAGAAPLVQGKKTTVQVFAVVAGPAGKTIPTATMLLHGRAKNGSPLPQSPLSSTGSGPPKPPPPAGQPKPPPAGLTLSPGDPNAVPLSVLKQKKGAFQLSLPWSWTTQPEIELEAELVPPSLYGKAECSLPACAANNRFRLQKVVFHDTGFLEVWPLGFTGGGNLDSPWNVFESAARALPVNEEEFRVDQTYRAYYDADNITNQKTLLATVKAYAGDLPTACKTLIPFRPAGCPDIVAGVRADGINGLSAGGADVYPPGPGKIVVNQSRPLTSVGHEIGHALTLQHADTACGGNDGDQDSEPWWPDPWGLLYGITSGGKVNGVGNVGTVGVKTNASWFDFMSYCGGDGNSWLSLVNHRRTFDVLRALQKFRVGSLAARATQASPGAVLSVVGYVEGDSVVVTRIKPRSGPAVVGKETSAYRAVLRNAVGAVIAEAPMEADGAAGHGGGVVVVAADLPLVGIAPGALPQAAYVLEILRDGAVVTSVVRSASRPRVSVGAPRRGQKVDGSKPVSVRWVARDADGDRLNADVDYSRDGGRSWTTVFAGLEESRVSLPAGTLARSARARIRVRVSDGFDETSAVSATFVSLGSAPSVRITEARRAAAITAADVLSLGAIAHDDAHRQLRGRSLKWFDGSRRVGVGTQLEVTRLAPGRHRFRVVARDRFGRTASDSLLVNVGAVAPRLVVRNAPLRLAPGARALRLRVASTIPATVTASGRAVFEKPAWKVGTAPRPLVIPLRSGAGPTRIVLRARAFGRSSQVTLTVKRSRA